jgi:predicted Zn-dependent protease
MPAITSRFQAETQQGTVQGLAAFIGYGGKTYALLGYTVPQKLDEYEPVLRQTIGSFKQLTDPEALNAQPARLEIVKTSQSMSLSQFNSLFPSSISLDELALINGVDKNATLKAGDMVKRVVGGVRKTALAQSAR